MPGSPTTPGRSGTCVCAPEHVAFRRYDSVGARNIGTFAAVAVGTGITSRPPHRSRRAAFPHRALPESANVFGMQSLACASNRERGPRLSDGLRR